jgi:predicted nucleic acid-binding protein
MMLYLDASALMKRYSSERGSRALVARFERDHRIYTSRLSFAEIHSSIGRKFRSKELNFQDFKKVREEFMEDWLFSLSVLDLDSGTLSALPHLVEQFDLKAGDAIHLSAAFWLKDEITLRVIGRPGEPVEFGVADRQLARIARQCGFCVFNPEDEN